MAIELSSVLGFIIGISGVVIGAFFTYFWQKKRDNQLEENEIKRTRYLCILLLMYTYINPSELESLRRHNRDEIKNMDDLKRELQTEWVNSWIFSDDNTLTQFKNFLEAPSETTFAETVLSMRKDLWGKNTKLPVSAFSIQSFSKTRTL